MAIQVKNINGADYVYFVDWQDGRRVETYCGAMSKPESERRALLLESGALRRRMAEMGDRLRELEARLEVTDAPVIAP